MELKMSLPLRERGLKSCCGIDHSVHIHVAPLAGAWIEIPREIRIITPWSSRSPCGSVD